MGEAPILTLGATARGWFLLRTDQAHRGRWGLSLQACRHVPSPLLPLSCNKDFFFPCTNHKETIVSGSFDCCFLVKGDANVQIASISEELAKKTEDAARQQEEITHLLSQIVDLQKKAKAVRLLFL